MSINMTKAKRDRQLSTLIMRIVLILFVTVSIYPLLFTIFTSVKSNADFYKNIWSVSLSPYWGNYPEAFWTGHLGEYFLNSVIIAAITLSVTLVTSILAAYALARLHVPFASLFILLLVLIQVLPGETLTVPLYLMYSKIGIMKMQYIPIAFAYIGWILPMPIIILKNFIDGIPSELIEAARIDGCGEMHTMIRIIIPLSKGAIVTCLLLNFVSIWGELMWARIATSLSTKGVPLTVGLLSFQGQYSTSWGLLCAAICIIIIPLIIMFIFTQKYLVKGLAEGAVKG